MTLLIIFLVCGFFASLPILMRLMDIINSLCDIFSHNKKKDSYGQTKEEFIQELKAKKAVTKGEAFEHQLRDMILFYLPGSKVRQNLIIKNGNFSKEIDLVALTPKGFFIVEAKDYNGCTINGNLKEKDWNCRYMNKEEYSLYNPLFQASSGVWNIKKHIPNIHFDKAVVFADNCKLSKEILSSRDVYTFSSFRETLMDLQELDDIYKDTFIEEIDNRLGHIESVSKEKHIQNVERIRNMQ